MCRPAAMIPYAQKLVRIQQQYGQLYMQNRPCSGQYTRINRRRIDAILRIAEHLWIRPYSRHRFAPNKYHLATVPAEIRLCFPNVWARRNYRFFFHHLKMKLSNRMQANYSIIKYQPECDFRWWSSCSTANDFSLFVLWTCNVPQFKDSWPNQHID